MQKRTVERRRFLFEENLSLYEKCQAINGTHFFALLPVMKGSMQKLVDKYIRAMPKIAGFKLYTGISEATLDETDFSNELPLIIHTGTYKNQHPRNMLNFISRYPGNIALAHFARLDTVFFASARELSNVYYDVSPAYEMLMRHKNGRKVFLCPRQNEIKDVDYMYRALINIVGIKHILWGSDEPYSNLRLEYAAFVKSSLSENERHAIFSDNPLSFLKIKRPHDHPLPMCN